MAAKNLPFVLETALLMLPSFILSLKWARPGAIRAMRPERRKSLEKVLEVLLYHCSLQFSGALCQISRVWIRPITIEEIAKLAGLKYCNVVRCLADLRALGFIAGTQIKRENKDTGRLEVSAGLRTFTKEFWDKLGLLEKARQAIEWAKQNGKRRFQISFKSITIKAKQTHSKTKTLATSVLKKLRDPETERTNNLINNVKYLI